MLFWGGKINRYNNFTELFGVSEDEECPPSSRIWHQQLPAGRAAAPAEAVNAHQEHERSSGQSGAAPDCYFSGNSLRYAAC